MVPTVVPLRQVASKWCLRLFRCDRLRVNGAYGCSAEEFFVCFFLAGAGGGEDSIDLC